MAGIPFNQLKPCAQALFRQIHRADIVDGRTTVYNEAAEVGFQVQTLETKSPPLRDSLAATLRECMHAYAGHWASHKVARLFVNIDRTDPDVIAHLYPWDRLMFLWRDNGISVDELETRLGEAGLGRKFTQAEREQLTAWAAEPLTAVAQDRELFTTIFGDRPVSTALRSDADFPDFADFFAELLNHLEVADPIEEVEHIFDNGTGPSDWEIPLDPAEDAPSPEEEYGDTSAVIRFLHRGITYEFCSFANWDEPDIRELIVNFNAFMTRIGRTERAFRIRVDEDFYDEVASFIVADPSRFLPFAEWLHVPLDGDAGEATPTLKVSKRWQYPDRPPAILRYHLTIKKCNRARYRDIEGSTKEIRIATSCELPKLRHGNHLNVGIWPDKAGNVSLPELTFLSGSAQLGGDGTKADNLVEVMGDLRLLSSMELPQLQKVGGKITVCNNGELRAPRLSKVGSSHGRIYAPLLIR